MNFELNSEQCLFDDSIRRFVDKELSQGALARARNKQLVAHKLDRSEVARSHTGAMVGSDAALDAFLKAHSIHRVDSLETRAPAVAIQGFPVRSLAERGVAEINPLIIGKAGDGCVAVDVLIRDDS